MKHIRTKTKIIALVSLSCVVAGIGASTAMLTVSSTYSASIISVSTDAVSGTVSHYDEEWNLADTNAAVTISSNKTASVEGLSDSGYYTVTFCSNTAEIGSAEFFLGTSGQIYTYEYIFEEEACAYLPTYTAVSSVSYTEFESKHLLDIGGSYQVTAVNIPTDVTTVNISMESESGDYGDRTDMVSVGSDGSLVIDNLGIAGDYWLAFSTDDDMVGMATFTMGENGALYTLDYAYDSTSGEWISTLTETDEIYFIDMDDAIEYAEDYDSEETYAVTVQNVPASVSAVEVQYLDNELTPMDIYTETTITEDGTVQVEDMYTGYYTLNFYDEDYNCIGYATFYLDKDGDAYAYELSADTEPVLTALSSVTYTALETKAEYTFGTYSIEIYGVPEEIDSIEIFYFTGDSTDETILFEPEYSSVYTEPLQVSGLGMAGRYKMSFYVDGEVQGNAEFYLNDAGVLYEYDYQYNAASGEWEKVLAETDSIYYYENTDFQDADDYDYGDIQLTIINVPTDVTYAEVTYFEDDASYTIGNPIFPEIKISGKGTAAITNLSTEGYYQVDLFKNDCVTKAGYVFFFIDSKGTVYQIEYQLNSDTLEVETIKTATNSITMKEYESNTVEYVTGDMSATIYNVPEGVNHALITCITSDGEYAIYETEVVVNADGTVVLLDLGMEGDYTVTFMEDKTYVGSAAFYLKEDGKTYEANYIYDDTGSLTIQLTVLSKVIFTESDVLLSYTVGDIDFSGTISILDVVLLQRYLLKSTTLTVSQYTNADLNGDGAVNVFDLALLKRKAIYG